VAGCGVRRQHRHHALPRRGAQVCRGASPPLRRAPVCPAGAQQSACTRAAVQRQGPCITLLGERAPASLLHAQHGLAQPGPQHTFVRQERWELGTISAGSLAAARPLCCTRRIGLAQAWSQRIFSRLERWSLACPLLTCRNKHLLKRPRLLRAGVEPRAGRR